MATNVIYNGIILHNVTTREFNQEVVYDNSHTDQLFSRITVTVVGYCHSQGTASWITGGITSPYVAPYPSQSSMPVSMTDWAEQIRRTLSTPRQSFRMEIEGTDATPTIVLLQVDPCNSPTTYGDMDNGPKPKYINVESIVSNKIFKVIFSIDLAVLICANYTSTQPFVLNNRWSVSEAMDENCYITRAIHGRLRLARSIDPNNKAFSGHAVKALVIPPLENGFKRESLTYIVSENGLDCEYTISDKQVHKSAPWPATKMEITHSAGTGDGITAKQSAYVHLEAPPTFPSAMLMIRALQLLRLRLGVDSTQKVFKYKIDSINFTNHIGAITAVDADMYISAAVLLNRVGGEENDNIFYTLIKRVSDDESLNGIGRIPGFENSIYDDHKSFYPDTYGYDPDGNNPRSPFHLYLVSCYLQMPCQEKVVIGHTDANLETLSVPAERIGGYQGYVYNGQFPPETSYDPTQYSNEHRQAIYTYCAQENKYSDDSLKIQCPIGSNNSSDPTQDTSKIIQLGPKQCKLNIICQFERVGAPPELPKPYETIQIPNTNINGTLLEKFESVFPPQLTNDGAKSVYRIDASYIYALSRPIANNEHIYLGNLPYINFDEETSRKHEGFSRISWYKNADGKDILGLD
jgi:hypothetical protein